MVAYALFSNDLVEAMEAEANKPREQKVEKHAKGGGGAVLTTEDFSGLRERIQKLIDEGVKIDLVVAIGPPIMMKFVSLLTKKFDIPTLVSLNTIMVDGTGMCGACRVSVGGETKFVCVDGPEFDGHKVDFDEMMKRLRMYEEHEKESMERLASK